jgi:prepilin-type N-terminal cleavage/methylation domain-containing protein
MRCAHSRGVTLVELLVVLALLSLVLGVSGLALASLREPREADALRELARARAQAIRTGVPARADTTISHLPSPLFLPDGRAIGPNVDPLTGAPRAP